MVSIPGLHKRLKIRAQFHCRGIKHKINSSISAGCAKRTVDAVEAVCGARMWRFAFSCWLPVFNFSSVFTFSVNKDSFLARKEKMLNIVVLNLFFGGFSLTFSARDEGEELAVVGPAKPVPGHHFRLIEHAATIAFFFNQRRPSDYSGLVRQYSKKMFSVHCSFNILRGRGAY